MSRNVLNGTVDMDFQKLDPATLQYVDMTDEEKASYKKDFAAMIENVRKQQAVADKKLGTSPIPNKDNVSANENDLQEGKVNEPAPVDAKVIQMS
jgi:hypothetical protein